MQSDFKFNHSCLNKIQDRSDIFILMKKIIKHHGEVK
jgi:hypothetical protein